MGKINNTNPLTSSVNEFFVHKKRRGTVYYEQYIEEMQADTTVTVEFRSFEFREHQ